MQKEVSFAAGVAEQTTTAEPTMITIPELSALLRVSLPTAYAAVKRGQVPGAVKMGRVWRLHRRTVLAWAQQGCVPQHGGKP